jgi:hypothetical protein
VNSENSEDEVCPHLLDSASEDDDHDYNEDGYSTDDTESEVGTTELIDKWTFIDLNRHYEAESIESEVSTTEMIVNRTPKNLIRHCEADDRYPIGCRMAPEAASADLQGVEESLTNGGSAGFANMGATVYATEATINASQVPSFQRITRLEVDSRSEANDITVPHAEMINHTELILTGAQLHDNKSDCTASTYDAGDTDNDEAEDGHDAADTQASPHSTGRRPQGREDEDTGNDNHNDSPHSDNYNDANHDGTDHYSHPPRTVHPRRGTYTNKDKGDNNDSSLHIFFANVTYFGRKRRNSSPPCLITLLVLLKPTCMANKLKLLTTNAVSPDG